MRSLRTTVALIVAITVALSVVGLAIGVWFLTRSALLGSVDSSLQSRLEAGIFLEPAEDAPPIIRPPISGQPTVLVDAVLSDGEVFEVDRESFDLPADPEDIRIAESAPGTQAYSTRIAPNGEEVRVLTVAVVDGALARGDADDPRGPRLDPRRRRPRSRGRRGGYRRACRTPFHHPARGCR
jgi:hypothetical protein